MERRLTLAVGQLGPIARDEPRAAVVRRLIALLETAKARGAAFGRLPRDGADDLLSPLAHHR